jgi:hypothetical protein
MAEKSMSNFMAHLPVMILIISKLDPVGIWEVRQNLEYESENEVHYSTNTSLSEQ